jgi:hypothetical protein
VDMRHRETNESSQVMDTACCIPGTGAIFKWTLQNIPANVQGAYSLSRVIPNSWIASAVSAPNPFAPA